MKQAHVHATVDLPVPGGPRTWRSCVPCSRRKFSSCSHISTTFGRTNMMRSSRDESRPLCVRKWAVTNKLGLTHGCYGTSSITLLGFCVLIFSFRPKTNELSGTTTSCSCVFGITHGSCSCVFGTTHGSCVLKIWDLIKFEQASFTLELAHICCMGGRE